MRVGHSYDIHRLVEGRPLILGGVTLPHPTGLLGHSDADALLHVIADALLGAAALGDLGHHFPDTDPAYKNSDSQELLKKVAELIQSKGFKINNIDTTIVAQAPKMAPYIMQMRQNIAQCLKLSLDTISVKARTNEGLDALGQEQAIAAWAVCLLST